jgi:hypothetical protein
MEAVRCTQCGETRWTLFGASLEDMLHAPCETCGGSVEIERRHPGQGPEDLESERRASEPPAARG